MAKDDQADRDNIADALSRMAQGAPSEHEPAPPPPPPPPPASAAEFRRATPPTPKPASPRPTSPNPAAAQPATPKPKPAAGKPRQARPDRPDRPTGPGYTGAVDYDPARIVDDGDAVIVPAPEPAVFAPPAPAKKPPAPLGIPASLAFRRTIIPILLTCGVLLLGIGLLKWVGGADSVFSDMTTVLSATLCGAGAFLLLVAALNMLQVRAELAQGAGK